jgi:hypothetical protein
MTASTFEYVEEEDDGDLDESVPVEGESYDSKKKYSKAQLEELADALLREDSNKELCRQCKEKDANSLPYGSETGHTEWALRKDASGAAVLDDEGNAQYIAFPELSCDGIRVREPVETSTAKTPFCLSSTSITESAERSTSRTAFQIRHSQLTGGVDLP